MFMEVKAAQEQEQEQEQESSPRVWPRHPEAGLRPSPQTHRSRSRSRSRKRSKVDFKTFAKYFFHLALKFRRTGPGPAGLSEDPVGTVVPLSRMRV